MTNARRRLAPACDVRPSGEVGGVPASKSANSHLIV